MEDYLSFSQPPSQIHDLDEDFTALISEFTNGLGDDAWLEFTNGLGDDAGLESTRSISGDSGMGFEHASGERLPGLTSQLIPTPPTPSPRTPKDHPASVPTVSPTIVTDSSSSLPAFASELARTPKDHPASVTTLSPTIVTDSSSSLPAFLSEPARTTSMTMYPTHGMPLYQHFPEQHFPAAFGPMGPGVQPIFHACSILPAHMDPSAPGPVVFMPWPLPQHQLMPWSLPQHAFAPWSPRQPASQPAAAAPSNKRAFEFVQPTVPDGFVANPNNHGRWEIDSVGNRKYLNAPKIKKPRVNGN